MYSLGSRTGQSAVDAGVVELGDAYLFLPVLPAPHGFQVGDVHAA
jgi:hypothetical protein